MKRYTRTFVILATVALAAVPMLAGCVVVPAGHYWARGSYAGHYDNRFDGRYDHRFDNRDAHPWR